VAGREELRMPLGQRVAHLPPERRRSVPRSRANSSAPSSLGCSSGRPRTWGGTVGRPYVDLVTAGESCPANLLIGRRAASLS
jgi:hypothetical protein